MRTETVESPDDGGDEAMNDTIVRRFRRRVADQPQRTALRWSDGGRWRTLDWRDYGVAVDEVAAGLIALDVAPGDRVAIVSANRPEWHIADLGTLTAGAISVPIYPTSSSSQVAYVLAQSGARVCFVDDAEQLAKILLHVESLPELRRVIMLDGAPGLDRPALVLPLDHLRSMAAVDDVETRVAAIGRDDIATLVYTSGTTGPPKGARLTHGSIVWTIDAVDQMVGLRPTDRTLSYLPLSHIAERVTSHFGMIAAGGETWFARSLSTVPEDLRACRPTIFLAVPRVWQKLHDSILDQLDRGPVRLGAILDHAATTEPDPGRPWWSVSGLLGTATLVAIDETLGRTVRRRTGLDRARLLVSAAAPIHPDLVRWFHGIGLPIAEVYGQTEDCGPATVNPPDDIRIGSVGRPIPGLEVRTADDGELLVRGGSVCAGYHDLPDASAELIDADGWMHTGDLGRIDDDGYVWITGRKKDLIINAAGKNIAPSELEARLSIEPLIGQAVVIGDGRRYLTALIALDADAAADWARRHGTFHELADLVRDDEIRAQIDAAVERVNREHSPVEQIKYWRLLPEPLTVESGEVTPTYKVKRSVVEQRYHDLIDTMYATPDQTRAAS